jgi:hypothetical protein
MMRTKRSLLCLIFLVHFVMVSRASAQAIYANPSDEHAFDFDLGNWKTHTTRLLHPLSASNDWVEMDGVTVVKPVWGGRANIAEYKADGPAGHVELMALRWYNPEAHQWNIGFSTPKGGGFGTPGVGEFKDGRVDFYDQEQFNGRSILVRFSMWGITHDSAQSEQAFSADGGKTWETNWINKYTRIGEEPRIDWDRSNVDPAGAHDFDFNLGTWHTQIHRVADPFTAPGTSMAMSGTVTVRKLWGGRAQLEEIEADGPKGHWEGLTLFLYNPKARQWSQIFLNSHEGTLSTPLTGEFREGRGELYSQDTFKDRTILIRGVWSEISRDSHRYEESYSQDGGRSWKTAFRGDLTRAKS